MPGSSSRLVLAVALLAAACGPIEQARQPPPKPPWEEGADAGASQPYPPFSPMPAAPMASDCTPDPRYDAAANDNARSLSQAPWDAFGRIHQGWRIYLPHVARELGTACAAESTAFARRLAAWQGGHGLPADGRMTPATFGAMVQAWHGRRPFSKVLPENCPAPPADDRLAALSPGETYGGKAIRLRRRALEAYRAMVAAARRDSPEIAADPLALRVYSGFRDPAADLARCFTDGACDGVRRTWCSAHRTGLAVDLYIPPAPGQRPDSSEESNRLFMSRTAAYRWMVANADRYGFVNYAFEPWHWEWVGEPI